MQKAFKNKDLRSTLKGGAEERGSRRLQRPTSTHFGFAVLPHALRSRQRGGERPKSAASERAPRASSVVSKPTATKSTPAAR